MYDKNKFREGLHNGKKYFQSLPMIDNVEKGKIKENGKFKLLNEILIGLHANPSLGNLKSLGISTPFGKMQFASGISLSENAILCYQSPTGIFERRVALKDL